MTVTATLEEIMPVGFSVHGQTCMGCVRHNRSVLLALYQGTKFKDVFLTTQQAEQLIKELRSTLYWNGSRSFRNERPKRTFHKAKLHKLKKRER
jgi:hypothetical protein